MVVVNCGIDCFGFYDILGGDFLFKIVVNVVVFDDWVILFVWGLVGKLDCVVVLGYSVIVVNFIVVYLGIVVLGD